MTERQKWPSKCSQLAVEMVTLVGARPPSAPLMVAGGRTDTTMTAAVTTAAVAMMTTVARAIVAATRA